jgi:hypothetical protein
MYIEQTHRTTSSHFINEMIKKEQEQKNHSQIIVKKNLDEYVAVMLQEKFRVIDSRK